jgi:chitinase
MKFISPDQSNAACSTLGPQRVAKRFVRGACSALALMASLVLGSTAALAQSDVTSPGDSITFSGGSSSGNEGPANAIDNNTGTKYLNSYQVNSLTIRPSRGASVVTGVRFATANDAPERDPAYVEIYGSNDGTNFVYISGTNSGLYNVTGPVPNRSTYGPAQTFANTRVYTYYRLNFGSIRDNTNTSIMQFSEVELLGTFGPFHAINNVSQAEGNSGTSNFVFTVTRGGDVSSASSVNYSVSDGATNPATAGSDYGTGFDSDGGTPGVLNFAANATSGTITVPVIGDTIAEPDELFLVTLSNPSSGAITTNTSAGTGVGLGTILNDDTAVSNSVPGSKVYFTTLGTPAATDTLGRVNTDGSGATTLASGASAFSNAVGVAVDPVAGFVYVADSTSPYNLLRYNLDGTNRTVIYTAVATGSRGLRDVVWEPTNRQLYVIDGYSVIRLNPDGSGATRIVSGTDISGNNNGQPTALAVDAARGFIYLTNPSTLVYPEDAIQRFKLDGSGQTSLISKQDYSGSSGTNYTYNSLYLDSDTGDVYGTSYTGSGVTDANNGNGRVVRFNSSGAVTVLLSGLPAPQAVAIDKANGYLYEGERGFGPYPTYARINRYNLSTLNGRTQLASVDPAAAGTANTDLGGIAVYIPSTVSIGNASIAEGNSGTSTLSFPITLSYALTAAVTVTYSTSNGTATAGSDYTAVTGGTVTIPAGQTTGVIPITILGDTTFEPDETLTVTLTGVTNAVLGTPSAATGTIQNDDSNVTATFSISNTSSLEGSSSTPVKLNFSVQLSAAATQAVTVNYATSNGTATAGSDYTATAGSDYTATAGSDYTATAGTLTIPAGSTTATIAVPILGDTTYEANETFNLNLTSPNGATLAGGVSTLTATGTIQNDDAFPVVTLNGVTQNEGNANTSLFNFTVSLSNPSSSAVTLNYATADGDATAGSDYVAASGTVTILAGQVSATISVTANGDTTVEPDETFTLALSNLSGGSFPNAATTLSANGTLVNDDANTTPTASDVSGQFTVYKSSVSRNRGTGRYVMNLVIQNNGAALNGPLYLALDGLGAGLSLYNPDGFTNRTTPANSPYRTLVLPGGAAGTFAAGTAQNLTIEIVNPANAALTFSTRLLQGPGTP